MLVTSDRKVSVSGRWEEWIVLKWKATEELMLVKGCAVYNHDINKLQRYVVGEKSFFELCELMNPDEVLTLIDDK